MLQVEAELICALTISISRREQGVNERRTSLHTRCCFAFCYKRFLICIIISEI